MIRDPFQSVFAQEGESVSCPSGHDVGAKEFCRSWIDVQKRTLQAGGCLASRAVVRHPVVEIGRGFYPVANADQGEVIKGKSVGNAAKWLGRGNLQPWSARHCAGIGVD